MRSTGYILTSDSNLSSSIMSNLFVQLSLRRSNDKYPLKECIMLNLVSLYLDLYKPCCGDSLHRTRIISCNSADADAGAD